MSVSNEERRVFTEIQKKLFYMIPERWDAIYLYASIIEEPFKKPVGEMYFYYMPKGILKRKPVNVYEIPGMFNIDEEGYNEIIQSLYSDIKKLRGVHRETRQELWSNITISIKNCQFKIEYAYDDLRQSAEFSPYERHIIWRYKYLGIESDFQTKEEQSIIERYLDSVLIQNEIENNDVYVEGIYEQPVHNIIDYEKTLTVEAAIASNNAKVEENFKQLKDKKEKIKNEKPQKNKRKTEKEESKTDNETELRVKAKAQTYEFRNKEIIEKMSNIKKEITVKKENKIDDDMILSSDFMTKKYDD